MLARSVEQYQAILGQLEELQEGLSCSSPEELREQAARMVALQQVASSQDEELFPLLELDPDFWGTHAMFRQRRGLIEDIFRLNELLLPKIRGIMAVTSVELEQLRGGRKALTGYATHVGDRRGLRGVG